MRSRWRFIRLTRRRVFAQDSEDPIQLVEQEEIGGPAGKLNNESPENDLIRVNAESDPDDPIQRIFRDIDEVTTTEFRPQRLTEGGQRNGLLLQIS